MPGKKKQQHQQSAATAVALTIAGSDSSAGAGAQADLKTFGALGVYGVTAITCIVAETPGKVSQMQLADAAIVREQIVLLQESFPIAAIKTGLLCNAQIVSVVAEALRQTTRQTGTRNLVVDPLMIATTGQPLLDGGAIEIYGRELFPLARLITPNLDESSRLLGEPITDLPGMHRAAAALAKKFRVAVLLKGGHLRGRFAVDVLHDGIQAIEFSAPFLANVATHGTGCTYSAAITAELAKGAGLSEAVKFGKQFVSAAIRQHFVWNSSGGRVSALNQGLKFRPS